MPETTFTSSSAKGSVLKFNVTQTVRDFKSAPALNFGWLFRTKRPTAPLAEAYGMKFYGTNHAGFESSYPKLVITYSTASVGATHRHTTQDRGFATRSVLSGRTLRIRASSGSYRVTMTTVSGRCGFSRTMAGGQSVDLSALSSGLYLLKIQGAGVASLSPVTLE